MVTALVTLSTSIQSTINIFHNKSWNVWDLAELLDTATFEQDHTSRAFGRVLLDIFIQISYLF